MTVKRYRVPRWLAAPAAILIYGAVDVGAPVALSTIGHRHGWDGGRPHPLNLLGVAGVVGGAILVVLAARSHGTAARELDWKVLKLDPDHLLTPDYLLTEGVYSHTRNPLYVGDLFMWAGWAVLFGSIPVAIGFAGLLVGLQIGLRLEERGLARQFGEKWRRYAATTPRFIRLRSR
jgi:protein-S-isoprenylcysteine O-methyltransferase Ste14